MARNDELILTRYSLMLGGLANLVMKENRRWWGTRYWLAQLAVWLIIINGMVALIYSMPVEQMFGSSTENTSSSEQATIQLMKQNPEMIGLSSFLRLAGIVMVVGVVVISQGAMISEKQSGTAAWVLSKPVSRSAFILSKLAGYGLGFLGIMCILVGAVLYEEIWLMTGVHVKLLPFIEMLGLVFLNLFFYLALSIMLGTLFDSRGAIVGIPLIVLFSYMILLDVPGWLVAIMPWNLVDELSQPALAYSVVQSQPIQSITPLVATVLWCILFIGVGIWRFRREEF